eukprot:TRINITY_DN23354_c0_g1_i1.p1 TRINITY_DN23354_c0_g1~~TRINITY_DN23354_c0_g1_i1.p1  ORF type:complete len:857 (+),score=98.09 TRINITY_DN23354_c0_g1_i1:48-2618(+)
MWQVKVADDAALDREDGALTDALLVASRPRSAGLLQGLRGVVWGSRPGSAQPDGSLLVCTRPRLLGEFQPSFSCEGRNGNHDGVQDGGAVGSSANAGGSETMSTLFAGAVVSRTHACGAHGPASASVNVGLDVTSGGATRSGMGNVRSSNTQHFARTPKPLTKNIEGLTPFGGGLSPKTNCPMSALRVGGRLVPQAEELVEAQYHEVLVSIEAAMAGRHGQTVSPLASGTCCEGCTSFGQSQAYTVRLPRKPAVLFVTVTRASSSATAPTVYGSTMDHFPGPGRCEVQADDAGRLIYEHSGELSASPAVAAAPLSTGGKSAAKAEATMYLSVQGRDGAACSFKIKCSLKNPWSSRRGSLDPTNGEQMQSHSSTLAGMMATLRGDPEKRREFDSRVRHLRRKRIRARAEGLMHFDAVHLAEINDRAEGLDVVPARQARRREDKKVCADHRRAVQDREKEERMRWWAGKEEAKRALKAEIVAKAQAELAKARSLEALLEAFAVVGFTFSLVRRFKEMQSFRAAIANKIRACKRIQRFILRALTRCRQKKMYRNVLRLRLAATSHARHVQASIREVSRRRLVWFFQSVIGSVEDMSLAMGMQRFMTRVRLLQRFWRRCKRIRLARVEALLPHFTVDSLYSKLSCICEDRPKNSVAVTTVARRTTVARTRPRLLTGDKDDKRKSRANFGRRTNTCELTVPGTASLILADFDGEELLPRWLRVHVLYKHVRIMNVKFAVQLRKWNAIKSASYIEEDLVKMGMGDSAQLKISVERRPTPLDISRLPNLYIDTYKSWHQNNFKHLVHNRNRVLRKTLLVWSRLAHHISITSNSPSRTPQDAKTQFHRQGFHISHPTVNTAFGM